MNQSNFCYTFESKSFFTDEGNGSAYLFRSNNTEFSVGLEHGWEECSLSFCDVNQFSLLGMVGMDPVFWHGWEECSLSFCDVNQFSLLGMVGMDSVFPFVMWTNSIFWAWFGCTQSFLLWCRPIQSFGHGWDEFSASFCDVVTTWSWWIFEAIIKVRRVWSPFWSPIQSVGMWNGSVLSFSM